MLKQSGGFRLTRILHPVIHRLPKIADALENLFESVPCGGVRHSFLHLLSRQWGKDGNVV